MPPASPSADLVRFGVFELNRRSGELRKAGVRVNLQEQSLQVLASLLERPGDLVTRDELRQRLWPTGTFGDFDHGLNAVINRLREALGDSADSPRFIETLPRRGYRFVAPIEPDRTASSDIGSETPVDRTPSVGKGPFRRRAAATVLVLAVGLIALVAGAVWRWRRSSPVEGPPPQVVSVTRLAGDEDWPSFSPDGEQVAFSWGGEKGDNTDIYVALVGATEVRRLTTDPADDIAPSWSPDGRHIAFLRDVGQTSRIYITSPLGGTYLKVSDFPVRCCDADQISWSPDGQFIVAGRDVAAAPGTGGIYLIPVNGGEPRAITQPSPPGFDHSPVFSRDGRQLAYLSCAQNGCQVRVADVNDSLTVISEGRPLLQKPFYQIQGLAWCRDGRSLLFGTLFPDDSAVWRLSIDGRRPLERLSLDGFVTHPAAVGTRDRVAISRAPSDPFDAHLYRFNPAGTDELIAESSTWEYDPHFSPDGRRLAFTSGRSGELGIWTAAADGTGAQALTHGKWVWGGSPSWSPDGKTIAFDGMNRDGSVHLWAVDADGGPARQLTNDVGGQSAPTWSTDGKWIYYVVDAGGPLNVWRIQSTGGQREQVTHSGSGSLAYESFDGTSLLYQPRPEDSALLLQPLAGGHFRQLVGCVRNDSFATAGRMVFYVACEPGENPTLHSIDIVNGRDRPLGTLEHFPPGLPHVNLAVSPDAKTVVYLGRVRLGADLMMIENFR